MPVARHPYRDLSDENRTLLTAIKESQPESIATLADLTVRKASNLSRRLNTMSRYGFVEMRRENNHVRPAVKSIELIQTTLFEFLTTTARTGIISSRSQRGIPHRAWRRMSLLSSC